MSSPIRMTGLVSGLDTESIVSALVSNYSSKVDKYKKAQTKLSWTQDAWKEVNTEVYSLYTNVSNLRFSAAYNLKTSTVSDKTKVSVTTSNTTAIGTHTLEIKALAKSKYVTGSKIKSNSDDGKVTSTTKISELLQGVSKDSSGEISYSDSPVFTDGGKILVKSNTSDKGTFIDINKDMTVAGFVAKLNSAGVQANFDEANQRIFISSAKSGEKNAFSIQAVDADGNEDSSGESYKAISALGFGSLKTSIDASDAEILLDGETYKAVSNSITVNGLTINAQGLTSDPVTITTTTDVQGLYDKIKDFFTQYNNVINDLNSRYNADSANGYEPLTDEERTAMGETTANKYEDKIKTSLLRRDSTLDGLMSAMSRSLSKSYTINGKSYSLTDFGIHTLGYLNAAKNEEYAYHIDGDSDDSTVSSKKDKLMQALTEDPDTVMEVMKQAASSLYSELDTKMKSTTLSSAYTVYNDKEMTSEYNNYTSLIKEWQQKLEDQEDYYYQKFSKMESSLSQLNSTQSSLSGYFSS